MILGHELSPVSLSLADRTDDLHQTQKTAIGQILEAGINVETLLVSDTCNILTVKLMCRQSGNPSLQTHLVTLFIQFNLSRHAYESTL